MIVASGWLKDVVDARDRNFSSLVNESSFRSSSDVGGKKLVEKSPISNQGQLSSCVANATVDALEVLLGLENLEVQQLSRLFVYYNARNYEDATRGDFGTYIRLAFKSLTEFGVCLEAEWSYDPNTVFMQPTLSCYKTATDNKIAGYYRIVEEDDQRVQAVVSAIQADHPVVFGTAIGQELLSFAGTDTVYAPKKSIGNHAMMIVGWRSSPTLSFYVRNSWGQAWGDGTGHFWIDADYIASSLSDDFWVPTLMSSIC